MKILVFCMIVSFAIGCANNAPPVQNTANSAPVASKPERIESVAAHTTENQTPRSADVTSPLPAQTKWTQSGDAIDTTEFDSAIMSAEKALGGTPAQPAAKKALGTAYLRRAVALTDARQYAAALGDYRRTLKYDPANTEAKDWIERITSIYSSINRASPKEGEEPPPLPFTKSK